LAALFINYALFSFFGEMAGKNSKIGVTNTSIFPIILSAMRQLQLSARAFHRVLKLARTIADLAGSEPIAPNHLAEALQYRPKIMLDNS